MRKLVLILVAAVLVPLGVAQNYDSDSYYYAGKIAAYTSGLVLLECPFLEHPEYADEVTCVETDEAPNAVRSGADEAMERHVDRSGPSGPTGWVEHEAGYQLRGYELRTGDGGLRVELHDLGESRLVTIYALH